MVLTFDPSSDYLYFDNTEAITFYSIGYSSGSGTGGSFDNSFDASFDIGSGSGSITGVGLKRENHKDIEFGWDDTEVSHHECIWELWKSSLSVNVKPKRGDYFTDASSNTWEVAGVDYSTFLTRYRLKCFLRGHNG